MGTVNRNYPLVPTFRELEFLGEPRDIDALVAAVQRRLEPPWSRASKVEVSDLLAHEFRVFRREQVEDVPAVLLHLLDDGRRIYVPNIVPAEPGSLSIDQYNSVLVDFADRFGRGAAEETGLQLALGPDLIDLKDEIGDLALEALLSFSRGSNRSTGSAHPSDRERWHDFMIILHGSGRELGSGLLQEFLTLDGWPESTAWDLVLEFEFGMGLLRRVDPR